VKVNIIQFDPVVGGETTLCNALSAILSKEHTIRVIHPVHLTKRGKLRIDSKWGRVEGEEFMSYSDTARACDDSDYIFCINAKHVKGSVKSDKRAIAQADSDSFFDQFEGKNFIFYEHGFHTWRLYNYESLFTKLMTKGNTIRVLTNTRMAIDFYDSKGYKAYLCRQPFNTDLYKPCIRNAAQETTNICFNSRYSATKGPHVVLKEFMDFFGKDLPFKLQFRGNISDPVSIWHNIDGVLLKQVIRSHPEIVFETFAKDISEVYDSQDYCVYAGYQTREERGKIEYAILEPIHYGIPLIAHSDVFSHFKYDEYGITEEELREAFIELTPENLEKIIGGEFDATPFVENSKRILEDFLPHRILERFNHCISSPHSVGRRVKELF
jgi:hypothetical protein